MAEPTTTFNGVEAAATPVSAGKLSVRAERLDTARGKFSWIPFSSDDQVREKQEEIREEVKTCD